MDNIGTDGFGYIYPTWPPSVSLSDCCPTLTSLTFVLFVNRESLDDWKKSDAVIPWRYALRLLSTAPPTLSSLRIGLRLAGDVKFEDLEQCTVPLIHWAKWNEVLQGFSGLQSVVFYSMDSDELYSKQNEVYHEPYQPRGLLSEHFAPRLEEHVRKGWSSIPREIVHFL